MELVSCLGHFFSFPVGDNTIQQDFIYFVANLAFSERLFAERKVSSLRHADQICSDNFKIFFFHLFYKVIPGSERKE